MAREYYSLPEAAAMLGISRIAVFKKVKKGQLPALRVGRNWAVPAAALGPGGAPAVIPPSRGAALPAKPVEPAPPAAPDAELDSMGWD